MVDPVQASRLRILVADPSEHVRAHLARVIGIEAGQVVQTTCSTPVELLAAAQIGDVDVALVGLGSDSWLDAIAAMAGINPTLPVVALGTTGSNDEIRAAMLAGGRAFVTKTASSDELQEAINGVTARHRPDIDVPAAPAREVGRIVAVVGVRGGSGCSTIALNLGVTAARNGVDTVVVDANPGFGDISMLAGVAVTRTVLDAAAAPDRVDEFLTPGPLGVGILASSPGPTAAAQVSTDDLRRILERLRERHDLVIVDSPRVVDDAHLMIVELADELLVTVIADMASLRNTRSYLALLESADLARDHRIVLNREGDMNGTNGTDFRAAFGRLDHSLPFNAIRVAHAGNRGIPVVVSDPESALARAFTEIVAAIASSAEGCTSASAAAPQRAKRLRWLRTPKPAVRAPSHGYQAGPLSLPGLVATGRGRGRPRLSGTMVKIAGSA
jgi:pilus assembly protein CpaE